MTTQLISLVANFVLSTLTENQLLLIEAPTDPPKGRLFFILYKVYLFEF